MPATYKYPGVYIEEIPSGVRTIMGVSTSTTAFVGRAKKGPTNKPVVIHNFGDFTRKFGGLWIKSTMSFAVKHYFLNGGSEAIIVRVAPQALSATFTIPCGAAGDLVLETSSPGDWGDNLKITVDYHTKDDPTDLAGLFNLFIRDPAPIGNDAAEELRNLSVNPDASRFIKKVLEQESNLLRVEESGNVPNERPDLTVEPGPSQNGDDGDDIQSADLVPASRADKHGMYALEDADIFNLLCLPPLTFEADVDPATFSDAAAYCEIRRAMLLVDAPASSRNPETAIADHVALKLPHKNAAYFFPRIRMANALKDNMLDDFVPCGAVAGVFARTDSQRGVWKAPAGIEATLTGVREFTYKLTDEQNGELNPRGINCLRMFKLIGPVVWGARTLRGADALTDEWKYVPIRRLALFIEESLYRGTKWVVFEPNDEPLWSQIRLNAGAFMHQLFRQGAFAGQSPRDAYFVQCNAETTTITDQRMGIVNILVGFAPLYPAEFVVIKIQQIAREAES